MKFFKKPLVFIFSCFLFLLVSLLANKKIHFFSSSVPAFAQSTDSQILISAKEGDQGFKAVIAQSSLEEPAVWVGDHKLNGELELRVYKATLTSLLEYLAHDEDNNQVNPDVRASELEQLVTINEPIAFAQKKILLPLEETGVWYLEARFKGETWVGKTFLIRSKTGVLVKEGNNELIFWGQDYASKRSINQGEVTVYNLENSIQTLAQSNFNQDGVAKTGISTDADIAIFKNGNDISLTPINLRFLEGNWGYNFFTPKERKAKFFTFTDRPLYKPGDVIKFKSIIRDDDDAVYSIPKGLAQVKIYSDDYDNPVFVDNFPITDEGSIAGEVTLPADASTDYYYLEVNLDATEEADYYNYNLRDYVYFQVEHYRKPEYSIDIEAEESELIAGDSSSFTITGSYFFGEPISKQTVKYKIYSAPYWSSDYYGQRKIELSDNYRYGYYWGKEVTSGTAVFNSQGEAVIDFEALLPEIDATASSYTSNTSKKSQIYAIEAEFDDGSGNSVFARKNILVRNGEFGIFKKNYQSTALLNQEIDVPIKLVAYQDDVQISKIDLTVKPVHQTWVREEVEGQKYPRFREEKKELKEFSIVTDKQGEATIKFTPEKLGSYVMTVVAEDSRGNQISKDFYFWITDEKQAVFSGQYEQHLDIQIDKEEYQFQDTVKAIISSSEPDRDLFLSFERDGVRRFQTVKLHAQTATVELPLQQTDMPNIFLSVASFTKGRLDSNNRVVHVSPDPQKLTVEIKANKERYVPAETVTLDIFTKDFAGNAIPAETAVWVVDKAIFELTNQGTADIFNRFWSERYLNTAKSHSLEGIFMMNMGGGGGCFTGDTQISIANGKDKAIKDIKIGDQVLTKKNPNDKPKATKVTKVFEHQVAGYFLVNASLKVTPEHIMWINDRWQTASHLKIGDKLRDSQNNEIEVVSLEWQDGLFKVFNLEVENAHTFFANDIWVHNQKGDGGGRKIFEDTAYWNPFVKTDANGHAQITFKLPDNLTTWVISSVGATQDTKVGQSTQEILVSKSVVLRPILPNLLLIEDEIVIPAILHNFTDEDHEFKVNLETDSAEILDQNKQTVIVKSGEFAQVAWHLKASQANEVAAFTFSAQASDNQELSDIITRKIPVRKFGFWEKTGENSEGSGSFTLSLNPDSDREKSKFTLLLSPSLISSLPSAMKYLVDYPYGCTEQTTSRFVPAVIAKENPQLFAEALKDKDLDAIINKSISKLADHQQSDGGWSWWSNGESDYFVTAYVLEYLLRAEKLGFDVNYFIKNQAKRFLSTLRQEDREKAANPSAEELRESIEELIIRSYALSLLGERLESFHGFEGLSPDILALAVMSNFNNGNTDPQTNGLDYLLSLAKEQGDSLYWPAGKSRYFGSQAASTALAIKALAKANYQLPKAGQAVKFLLKNRKNRYWANTFATAQIVQAAVDFAHSSEQTNPDFSFTVSLDNQQLHQALVNDSMQELEAVEIKGTDLAAATAQLAVERSAGPGQLYFTLLTEEFRTNKNADAVSHGINIKRKYVNTKGEDYSIGVGDIINVELTVGGLNSTDYYAVIEDQLPAGMLPINKKLKSEQFTQETDNYYSTAGQEVTENGMIISLYRISPKEKIYTYQARVVNQGKFIAPPAKVFLMYSPEIYARTTTETVEIMAESKASGFKRIQELIGADRQPIVLILLILIILLSLSLIGFLILKKKRPATFKKLKSKILALKKVRKKDNSEKN
ncbi:MAG: alpha-2-macroglobulin family protein [Candidatus Woesebacteria bacterium]|jgi:hypothetical protein